MTFLTSADSDVTAGSLLSSTNLGQENSLPPTGNHTGFARVPNHQYWQNSGPDISETDWGRSTYTWALTLVVIQGQKRLEMDLQTN